MWRVLAVGILLIVAATALLLWWIAANPSSSTDALAFIFLPLYALGAILVLVVIGAFVKMVATGREYARDKRQI